MMLTTPTVSYSNHVVAYLDVLGQREILHRLRQIGVPETPQEEQETMTLLRKSLGPIHYLRESFNDFVAARNTPADEKWPDWVPPEGLDEFTRINMKVRGFSDCLVVSSSLGQSSRFGPWPGVNAIHTLLLATSGLSLFALASGVAVRGGISIGPGVEIYGDEYYGPALIEAYRLESQEAAYPRVVIDEHLLELLNSPVPAVEPPALKQAIKAFCDRSLALCARDCDMLMMLDFLGPSIREIGPPFDSDLVWRAYRGAQEMLKRFTAARDYKLMRRYVRLLAYFESRLDLWDKPTEGR